MIMGMHVQQAPEDVMVRCPFGHVVCCIYVQYIISSHTQATAKLKMINDNKTEGDRIVNP